MGRRPPIRTKCRPPTEEEIDDLISDLEDMIVQCEDAGGDLQPKVQICYTIPRTGEPNCISAGLPSDINRLPDLDELCQDSSGDDAFGQPISNNPQACDAAKKIRQKFRDSLEKRIDELRKRVPSGAEERNISIEIETPCRVPPGNPAPPRRPFRNPILISPPTQPPYDGNPFN